MHRMKQDDRRGGFTLVMVCLLLVVMGMWVAVSIIGNGAGDNLRKSGDTIKKLNMVETRLTGFQLYNGRLPCPADGQYQEQTPNFGVEAANPGSCTGGTPAAPLGPDAGTGYIVAGTIPTKALHLGDEYGYDEWGRRITYVVDTRATVRHEGVKGRPQECP
jgi:hypothetical protein